MENGIESYGIPWISMECEASISFHHFSSMHFHGKLKDIPWNPWTLTMASMECYRNWYGKLDLVFLRDGKWHGKCLSLSEGWKTAWKIS